MQFNKWIESTAGNKIIITDRIKNGNRLLRKCNKENKYDIIGAKCVTLTQIATELLCAWAAIKGVEDDVEILSPVSCTYIVDDILRSGKSSFIPSESLCVRTAEELLQIINQIRMNKVTDEYIRAEDVKIKELKEIIDIYHSRLNELKQYDMPLLLMKACNVLKNMQERSELILCLPWLRSCKVGILADYEPTILEQQFIDEIKRLSDIHDITVLDFYKESECNKDVTYDFFKAYGVVNEVDYVIDRIQKDKPAYGDVNIFYTADEYAPFIQGALESRGIAYNFITGNNAAQTDQVQFMLSILDWAKDDFLYEKLAFVVENPRMTFGNKADSDNTDAVTVPATCYNKYLRKGIGWGKERYAECVKRVRADEAESKKYIYFNEFLTDLTDAFAEPEDCGGTYEKLVRLCSEYLRKSEKNNKIIAILKDQIPILEQAGRKQSAEECLQFIVEHLKGIMIKNDEENDAVSIIKVDRLEVLERPYNFVIGLSAKQFMADTKESPVLSDEELERYIKGKVRLGMNAGIEVRRNLERSFATLRQGRVIMGYAMFDTVELKESSPSVFYLDYYEKYGNGEQEYRTYKVLEGTININDKIIKERVEAYKAKTEVKEQIVQKVEATESIDEGITMSSSGLQVLLICTLKYYYHYVEMLPQREFLEKSDSSWLNAATKGTLFHYTLERYCEEILGDAVVDEEKSDRAAFEKIFEESVEKMLEEMPYNSKSVYEQEKDNTRELIWNFLCGLQKNLYVDCTVNRKKWRILGSELEFDGIEYEISKPDANSSEKSVKLLFNGSIDRLDGYVDEKGKLRLRIVDYKTGSRKNKEKEVKDNKQIQHYIYAMAALKYVEDNKDKLSELFGQSIDGVSIETAQYVFPYETQDNQIFDVTDYLNKNIKNNKYVLPQAVDEEIWNTLGVLQSKAPVEKKEVLEDIVKERAEKNETAKKEFCEYCSYIRQCRYKLDTRLL